MQHNEAILSDVSVGLLNRKSQQLNFKLECILLMLKGLFDS